MRKGVTHVGSSETLLDQIVMQNSVPGIFFSFTESKKELRIKTLSRLSGIESREIRRGSAYLLHRYGVPKRTVAAEELPPSWEKVKKVAEDAHRWLELLYLIECPRHMNIRQIEEQIQEVTRTRSSDQMIVVIDDSQRLGPVNQPIRDYFTNITEQL